MARTLFGWINALVAVMFVVSALLQYNDPDPLRWIVIYLAAAAACMAVFRPRGWWVAAAVGSLCLIWAATMAPRVLPDLQLGHLVKTMEVKTPQIEEGREMLGLAIIALWMAILVGWATLSKARKRMGPGGSRGLQNRQ